MLNNNHKKASCEFAEQIVSYFYDEANQAEKAAFETHLKNCSNCAAELADFGLVRASLIEWRDDEFLKLEAPVFEIPTVKMARPTIESDSRSWFSDFRKMFSFNPSLAAAVLASLIVCAGLVFIAINSSNNSDVATFDNKNVEKNSEKIAVSPTVERINEQPKEIVAQENSDNSLPDKYSKPSYSESKNSQSLPIREKRLASKDSIVRTSEKPETVRIVKETNKENKKPTAVQKQQVPSLTTFDDEEDKSVRLADLFAEIDAK